MIANQAEDEVEDDDPESALGRCWAAIPNWASVYRNYFMPSEGQALKKHCFITSGRANRLMMAEDVEEDGFEGVNWSQTPSKGNGDHSSGDLGEIKATTQLSSLA